jgi:hypothetical protein
MKKGDRIVCLDVEFINLLSIGKIYYVIKVEAYVAVLIHNDNDNKTWYKQNRFIHLKEYRKMKLQKLENS